VPAFFVFLILLFSLAAAPGSASPRQEEPRRIPGAEKVQVNLVLIDVVVRDRKDRPLSGLGRRDFELLVDRLPVEPADIETFEEICPAPPGDTAAPAQAATTAATAPAPSQTEFSVQRHIVLYLDFSQLTLSGRQQALRAARNHVAAHVGASDRVMILAFKRTLRLVQDFTSDAALLASRIDAMIDDVATLDTDVLDERQQMIEVASKGRDGVGGSYYARRELASMNADTMPGRAAGRITRLMVSDLVAPMA
jgi:VWFA-related protein